VTGARDWPERAWWSVAVVDALVIFVTVVVGLLYGWGVAVPLGVVLILLGLWWQLGPFWSPEQRARIRRRAQQRADSGQR
jgi:Flp pilus assembly protein TadB